MKNIYALFFYFVLLVFPLTTSAAVPSESALDAASLYLRQGESATVAPSVYTIQAKPYWIVYFHPQGVPTTRNLVVVVDADRGVVEGDEGKLLKAYEFERKISGFQEFQTQTGLSITSIDNKLKSGDLERAQAMSSLEALDEALAEDSENVRDLLAKQTVAFNNADLLRRELELVADQEQEFNSEKSDVTLDALLVRYNSTLAQLLRFIESSEAYRAAIINKTSELSKKGIPSSKYRSSLETAFRIGISDFPTSPVLRSSLQQFQGILSPSTQVNDTLASFLYRKEKSESDKLVESISGQVQQVLSSKAELATCTNITRLERAWAEVQAAQESNEFGKVRQQVAIVKTEVERITARYAECTRQTEPPKEGAAGDNSIYYYFAGLLLVVAIYLVYQFTQKKKDDNTGGAELEQPAASGSLFSK